MGDIKQEFLPHPLTPLLKPLGMAGRTEPAGTAGEHQKPLLPTVRAADAGKPAAGVAAVEVTLNYLLDDRAEESVLLLETALILGQETIKGPFKPGWRVCVVDDVVTTAGSTLKACQAVEEEGGKVVLTLAIVDRQEGGRENLEAKGYKFVSLVTRDELLK